MTLSLLIKLLVCFPGLSCTYCLWLSCCLQVTSYSLALREIDSVQDVGDAGSDGGYVPNVLEVVLRKKHLDMLQVGAWTGWAGRAAAHGCGHCSTRSSFQCVFEWRSHLSDDHFHILHLLSSRTWEVMCKTAQFGKATC